MNLHLTPEQEQIIQRELESGHFRTAEDVIASALHALLEKGEWPGLGLRPSGEEAVRRMLNFVEKNRVVLKDISVKELIHEDHKL
jgi:hypothetical protein